MSDDWITRLLHRFGPAAPAPPEDQADLGAIDQRLGQVEQSLSDIVIRLRLLERQADPRGIRGRAHDG